MSTDDRQEGDESENANTGQRDAREMPRTATEMAPGIPTGSGEGIDKALQQPDSDLGGGVAGDTTVDLETKEKPDRELIRTEDKDRTTL